MNPFRVVVALCVVVGLAGCAAPPQPTEIYDPYEAQNRRVHESSVRIDRAVLRPASRVYGEGVPEPVRRGVNNFSTNLQTPRYVVNDALQGNADDAVHNFFRFVINTTLGIGGIFDPASSIGLEVRESDFGETLHTWGAEEGAYIVLPVLGPSTERDAMGTFVDFAINPIGALVPDLAPWVSPTARVATIVDTRYRLGSTIDSVLYDSADSYLQTRSIYLQNRRFVLGDDSADEAFDIYEELYDE